MPIGRKRKRLGGRVPGVAIVVGLVVGVIAIVAAIMFNSGERSPKRTAMALSGEGPTVRVRLVAKADSVGVIVDGLPRTIAGRDVRDGAPLIFAGTDAEPVGVNGHRYHGTVRVVAGESPGTIDVINVCAVDDYLRGVVPREALSTWPAEALKAQAIASRTYALFQARSRTDSGDDRAFDLRADTGSQMYGGIESEVASTNRAVDATRGLVLASGPAGKQRIFCAYFSSTCGGTTASGADLFDDPTPALAAHEGDGCTDAPRYRWPEFAIRKDELARRLKLWGGRQSSPIAEIGRVRAVEIARTNELGRPVRFAITDDAGRRFELGAEHFRNACNAGRPEKDPEFYSSHFTPVDAGDSVRITDGRGWGHGVGLCQYCAAGWAKRGQSAAQILSSGYPGAILVRAY